MKKLIYLFVFAFIVATLSSCAGKKKGCGLTADAQVNNQEIVQAE